MERVGKVGGWSFNIDTMKQLWTDEVYRIHELEIKPDPSVEQEINYFTPESRPVIAEAVRRAIELGEGYDLELEIITAKGNRRAVHAIGRADLANRRIYGFFQDITLRKKAEAELREREARLKEFFEGMSTCAVVYGAVNDGGDFVIKELNPASEKASKVRRSDVVGKRILDVFPGAKEIGVFDALKRAWRTGERQFVPVALYKDERMSQWVENRIFRTESGDVVAMYDDMSEIKASEAKLARLNAELEQRVAARTLELESVNKELNAFAYSVSHDLRAPLRAIDGFSLAILDDYKDKLDAEGQAHLSRIRGGVQRMGALIDDLLKLSRVTRADLALENVDLSALAAQVAEELRAEQPGRSVECVIQKGVRANCDSHLLRVAMENLLGNACKFTGKQPKAKVEFGVSDPGPEKVFCVRDNGAGFDMKYGGKLFGAFQRLHKTEEFPGTGIGLATVQRIIVRHGGRVWAEAAPGKGAAFFFTLGAYKGGKV